MNIKCLLTNTIDIVRNIKSIFIGLFLGLIYVFLFPILYILFVTILFLVYEIYCSIKYIKEKILKIGGSYGI